MNIMQLIGATGVAAGLKTAAQRSARTAGRMVLAAVFAVTGIAFLTAAGWLWLAENFGATLANVVCGSIFLAGAAVFYLLGSRSDEARAVRRAVQPETPALDLPALATLAAIGVGFGRSLAR